MRFTDFVIQIVTVIIIESAALAVIIIESLAPDNTDKGARYKYYRILFQGS